MVMRVDSRDGNHSLDRVELELDGVKPPRRELVVANEVWAAAAQSEAHELTIPLDAHRIVLEQERGTVLVTDRSGPHHSARLDLGGERSRDPIDALGQPREFTAADD